MEWKHSHQSQSVSFHKFKRFAQNSVKSRTSFSSNFYIPSRNPTASNIIFSSSSNHLFVSWNSRQGICFRFINILFAFIPFEWGVRAWRYDGNWKWQTTDSQIEFVGYGGVWGRSQSEVVQIWILGEKDLWETCGIKHDQQGLGGSF